MNPLLDLLLLALLHSGIRVSGVDCYSISETVLKVKDQFHAESHLYRRHIFSSKRILRCCEEIPRDYGEPLLLTPYIENGQLEEGRKMATVPPFAGQVKSYAGFITVNKIFESNLFFWFFESESNGKDAPLIVWLQGGPGASSMYAVFIENGPYVVEKQSINVRKAYWSQHFNTIYIDNPVGTGFSFANENGYAQNQTDVGRDLLNFMLQFLKLFPHLQENKLYITGESYAGKYIPAFAHAIHKRKQKANNDIIKINLAGLFIGNGWSDPVNMLDYGSYLYQLGLIDSNANLEFRKIKRLTVELIEEEKWEEAAQMIDKMLGGEENMFFNYTGLSSYYNYYNSKSGEWTDNNDAFINSEKFRKAVHVGNLTFTEGGLVYEKLKKDIPKSVLKWIVELLDHYPITFYNGQLDVICAYPLTENVLKLMNWTYSAQYKHAKRHIFRVNNQVVGYYKQVANLKEFLIRDAGHMVPADQPEWALQMLLDSISK